ncbi:MAG: Panacea domain-containing protein [Actinomycetaceae bacterium]|nr:Panacea domain-containing protein [Actinomycetaceae bacterium]
MVAQATIVDVARYILRHFKDAIPTRKLQKLAYFSQGWSLGLRGCPIFADDFEAWRYGPVSRRLFELHRGMYTISERELSGGDIAALSKADRLVIDAVIQNYGALSGNQLSDLSHVPGGPWAMVRAARNLDAAAPSAQIIPQESIQTYFADLLEVDSEPVRKRA